MKYKTCIKYPSGYRYRRVVEVDGEEAAQAIANRLLDRCNAGFGNLPACRIESVELVMPIDEMLHVIRERAKNTAKLKAMTGGFPSQEQIDNNDFDGLYDFPEGRWKACNAILDKLQGVTI